MADEVVELSADERAGGCLAVALLAAVALVVLLAGLFIFGGKDEPTSWRVDNFEFEVANPGTLRVFADVTNTGDKVGSPSCSVRASAGAYRGYDTFELPVVAPGDVGRLMGLLVVSGDGAGFVEDATISCE